MSHRRILTQSARVERRARAWLLSSLLTLLLCASAHAQTGVSDDRVALPDGPGSIDGIGDNASVDDNMGAMRYSEPIAVPQGHPGMTPDLTLRYSSTAGNGVVGTGWTFMVPSIERLTLRGLPEYDRGDEMVANGSDQLVRVASASGAATYRSRFEQAFVRYTWREVADGTGGYWTAEFPDGRIGYYGADAAGALVPDARLEQAGDTFRWMLVEVVDPFDHRLRYEYDASSGTPLLTAVHWVHGADGAPRYRVELEYEDRTDTTSDASPGFEELLRVRLSAFRVSARGEVIRRYRLDYEDPTTSGGVSRLASVRCFGREGGLYPIVHRFTYSRSITGVCGAEMCDRPFVVDMGSVSGAAGLSRGESTLIDINGDALPDLLDTSVERHRFFLNRLDTEGQGHFDSAPVESAVGRRTPFALAQASVQVLDVNGDGFTDSDRLARRHHPLQPRPRRLGEPRGSRLRGALRNHGSAHRRAARARHRRLEQSGPAADPLRRPRRRSTDRHPSHRHRHRHPGLAEHVRRLHGAVGLEPIGAQFDGDTAQLAELNGDGLLDVVRIDDTGTVTYRLNYGRGRFSHDSADRAFSTADAPTLGSSGAIDLVSFEDLNGDGLDDMVLVEGSSVSIAINRNAGRFDPFRVIDTTTVPDLPARTPTTTVLFADMNGTGSIDVVWVEQTGQVRYLELFPVRPNLLARVENGIGMVWDVTYGRSVQERADAESPWAYPLTSPMTLVERTDTYVTLTGSESGGLHEVTEYRYRDGFYDGDEKAFRGFGQVERRTVADLRARRPGALADRRDLRPRRERSLSRRPDAHAPALLRRPGACAPGGAAHPRGLRGRRRGHDGTALPGAPHLRDRDAHHPSGGRCTRRVGDDTRRDAVRRLRKPDAHGGARRRPHGPAGGARGVRRVRLR